MANFVVYLSFLLYPSCFPLLFFYYAGIGNKSDCMVGEMTGEYAKSGTILLILFHWNGSIFLFSISKRIDKNLKILRRMQIARGKKRSSGIIAIETLHIL